MISNKKCSTEDFVIKSKNIFGDLYDYSKVDYVNNKIKVEIICKEHGSFLTRPDSHLTKKYGCKKCSSLKNGLLCRNKNWLSDFISIHGDLYDYSKVEYINNKKKVEIICKEHGSFFMKPNAHISEKQNCPRCYRVSNTDDFIKKSKKIHNGLYDYSEVKYIDCRTKVELICKEHSSFFMCPKEHINLKQGCPKCGKISMSDKHRKEIDLLISQFIELNSYLYDYSKVEYKNNNTKIDIICKKHGSFLQTPKSHLRGDGCPKCISSKGERKISSLLNNNNINYIIQKKYNDCLSNEGNKLRFDFYLPEKNICIEYDGEQHFRPIEYFGGMDRFNKQKLNDNIKDNYCLDNNIKLIRIPFNKYNDIEYILLSEINI